MSAVMNVKTAGIDAAERAFAGYIEQAGFPCMAAKTALSRDQITFFHAGSINSAAHDASLLEALGRFANPSAGITAFQSFAALFPTSPRQSAKAFERSLWQRLQHLHDLDARRHDWDGSVSSDPDSPEFSMSLGGHAFYVVGLHSGSTRRARRFPVTAMVFNLHRQFELLREEERYHRFSEAIIARDVAFHGSANPMLDEHGASSEARQYSGREVDEDWECPFNPKR